MRAATGPDKLVFLEPIPNEVSEAAAIVTRMEVDCDAKFCPESWTPERQPPNMVFAPHWYDLNALFTKTFGEFSVNVQGLSRVRRLISSPSIRPLIWFPPQRVCSHSAHSIGAISVPEKTSRCRFAISWNLDIRFWEKSPS